MHSKVLGYKQDITSNSNWVAHYLIREGFHLDYTIESLDEIERLFIENAYVILDQTSNNYLFALACYIGDVLVLHYKGEWIDNEHHVMVQGKKIYPYDVVNELLNHEKNYIHELKNL